MPIDWKTMEIILLLSKFLAQWTNITVINQLILQDTALLVHIYKHTK